MRLITLVVLLSATLQVAAVDKVLKTVTYYFNEDEIAVVNDEISCYGFDEPCWQYFGGNASLSGSEDGLELTLDSYWEPVRLLSKASFPETVKTVIVDMGAKAYATSEAPPELRIDNQSKELDFVNLYEESYGPYWDYQYPDMTYDDYTFTNVSTDSDGHLEIEFLNNNGAYFYIRSITVQYEAEPDPEPYAVLSEENTKLTFYYNNEKPDGALSVGPFNNLEFQSWYSSRENITSVVFDASFANCTSITSTAFWFYDCTNLTDITGIEYLKTDNVTEMNYMFTLCSRLTNLDVSNFNTANVTNMSAMFSGCSELTSLDVSKFNTAKVTNMSDMFNGCSRLTGIDVTNFNTTNVTYLNGMFSGCSKLTTLDISSFNTAIVTEMIDMFNGCSSLTTIYAADNWTTENVTLGADMFKACTSLVGGVGDTKTVFSPAHTDYSYAIINSETTSGYFTNLRYGPPGAYALLSSDNTVLTFYYDGRKKYLNGMSIGPFNSSSERPWNSKISNITSVVFDSSFANCTSITSTAYWFSTLMNVTDFTGLDYLNTVNVTSMNSMFDNCIKVESLDVSSFDTRNVTNMGNMFSSCMKLKSLDVSKFDTRNVTNMYQMFIGCMNLTTLDVSHFDTRNVTSMYAMFRGCSSLTSLDVNNFDVSKVTSFWSMFHSCTNLTSIFCDNSWIKEYVDSNGMFSKCISLTNYAPSRDSNHNPIEYARPIAYGGYFTPTSEKEDPNVISEPYAVLSEDNTVLTFYYDDQKEIRNGMSVGPFSKGEDIGWFSLDSKITTVVFDGSFAKCTSLTSTAYWFYMCQKLTSITGIENLKTNKVTDMSWMFSNCNVLNNVDVSGFNTYNVTNMSNMFLGCYALANINVSNFITSNVTDMSSMFEGCRSLTDLDVDNFNTAKVTTMSHMFDHCESLTVLDLCSFNTSKLSDVSHMFSDSKNLTTIYVKSNWIHDGGSFNDTSMFEGAVSLVGGAGTVYDMYRIDYNYAHIDEGEDNPGYFSNYAEPYAVLTDNEDGTTKTLTFYYDYQKAEHTNALSIGPFDYVTSWDSDKEKITSVVFHESFDNYKKLSSTYYWFAYCKKLATITGIEYLHTDKVTDMGQMFNQCESLTSLDVSHFNTEKVTNMNLMFCSCEKLAVLDVSGFNTANVNYMGSMFSGCSGVATLDVSHFNTERVISMGGMFSGCSSLTDLDVSNFNTGQVIDMEHTFRGLTNLATLDVSNLNTSNVTDMYFMFADNSGLTSLDLSNFNTAKVTRMGYMFSNCSKLETIFVGEGWTTNNIGDSSLDKQSVFSSCTALVGGAGTPYNSSNTDIIYARVDGGPTSDTPGYFTRGSWSEPYAVLTDNDDEVTTEDGTTTKGKTLTFYYDRKKADNNGMSVGPFSYSEAQSWCNARNSITKVEFDASFANCTSITSTAYWFYDCTNLTDITGVENLKTDNVTDMNRMFYGCSGLTSLDVSNFKTDNVTDMYCMFYGCSSLVSLDVSNFSTENVTNMGNMFRGCSGLSSLDLSNFNTANVTDMGQMFSSCSGLKILDVSNFNTANVTNMNAMFYSCSGLTSLDVGNFNTENVTNMGDMFLGCSGLTSLDVSSFNTANVTNMYGMFMNCSGLTSLDLSNFNTANVTRMDWMFGGCSGLTSLDLSSFNTANVTNMYGMFMNCSGLTSLDLSNFNTANVTEMTFMFSGCSGLTSLDVSNFNTANVTNMDSMFLGCSGLTSLDLSNFNTANVTNMYWMFYGCSGLTTIQVDDDWNTDNVTYGNNMFRDCTKLVGGAGTVYDVYYVDASYAHIDGGASNPGYLTEKKYAYASLNEDNTVLTFYYDGHKMDRGGMSVGPFSDYSEKGWYDQKGIITKVVFDDSFAQYTELTSTFSWFDMCNNLATVEGLNNLNTENVLNMRSMFEACSSLTSLDLSNFNTAKVKDFGLMFAGCTNLATIYVGEGWSTGAVTEESTYMFADCTKLVGGDGTVYSADHVDASYAHIDGGEDNPGYFTQGMEPEPYAVLTDNDDDVTTDEGTVKGKTLTFYYDSKKVAHGGMSVGPFEYGLDRGWNSETSNITKVVFDDSFANCTSLTSTAWWFDECLNLTLINGISNLKTENVTNMRCMFYNCSGLASLDVSHFKTDNVTNMAGMFGSCSALTSLDVINFKTDNVTDMSSMFRGCSGLTSLDLSSFNTSSVTNMQWMFNGCSGLTSLDINSFNTENVINMWAMFAGCSNVSNLYVSNFQTDNVTNMGQMFRNCSSLTSLDVSGFNTTNVTSMEYMFGVCSGLTILDVSGFNTEKVTDMSSMFASCSSLTSLDVSNFKTDNVTRMAYMFAWCSGLTSLGVKNFKTDNVTSMGYMFAYCSGLTSLDVNNFKTDNVTDMSSMFRGCSGLTSLDVTNFKTDNVKNMISMFHGCSGLTNLDVTNFKTDNVTEMTGIFDSCSGLTSLDVSNFKTDNVTSMSTMFERCSGLTSLDLTNFKTDNVKDMSYMFNSCSDLTTITVGSEWSTTNVTDSENMFGGCTSLKGGAGTTYDAAHRDKEYAHIDGGTDNPGYFTSVDKLGDVNGDGFVNIADAQAMVSYILGTYEGTFNVSLADMNNDGAIDIFDVTLVVNIVLEDDTNNPSGSRVMTRGDISQAEIIKVKAEGNGISLAIDEAERYTAFQFDLKLPEGVELTSVKLASDIPDYLLRFVKHQGNRYRVIGLSLSNEVLSTVDGQLIKLLVSDSVDETDVSIDNVLFVTPSNKVVTHIGGIEYNQQAEDDTIYNLSGQKLNVKRQQLSKGVYIINHKKVIIK